MKHSTLTLLLLFCVCTCGSAQLILTGSVIDGKTEEALPYVYLKLDGVALGTVTEADGTYRLTVPTKYAALDVVFSYLGYQDRRITVRELSGLTAPLRLEATTTELEEITVTPRKLPSARAILNRAERNVDNNYPQENTFNEGYYRETLKENGVYIKLSDAAATYHAAAYDGKKHKWKHYTSPYDWGTTLQNTSSYAGAELHRVHFHHLTLKTEYVHIDDARASENGSTRNMEASIIGGPLSLFARDRVKYPESFLGKKRMRDFDYLVDEVKDDEGKWVYAVHFRTTTTKAGLEELVAMKSNKRKFSAYALANERKLLEGTIFIDQENYAVLGYRCNVPNELKPYFCSYKTMAIKHFDYKLEARYKKVEDVYVLDYLRHEDEFIFKDTTDTTTTPYIATSEWKRITTTQSPTQDLPEDKQFRNVNSNVLYELPLEYDSMYWVRYESEHPEALIGEDIRRDMETKKTLEQQFGDKQRKDPNLKPPVAIKEPRITQLHGDKLVDEYAWMKDTTNPSANKRVMDYLRAENNYSENYFKPLRKLQRDLFRRLANQVEKDYVSLPTKDNGFLYFYEYNADDEYPIYFRAPIDKPQDKDTLFNVKAEAENYNYYDVAGIKVSPNNQLMAYAENTTGSDRYVTKFRNISDGTGSPDSLINIASLEWLDDATVLYALQDPKTLRTYQVNRHRLGTPQSEDVVIYEETDRLFSVGVSRSKSKEYFFIGSGSSDASELRFIKREAPFAEPRLVLGREEGHQYSLNHYADKFYIQSNGNNAFNGAVYVADTSDFRRKNWTPVIPHRKEVMLEGFVVFDNYFVVAEKEEAQSRVRIIDRQTDKSENVKVKEDFYSISFGYNPDTDTDTLQFSYSSFDTPTTVVDYHMGTGEERIVRTQRKLYNPGKLITRREYATAPDGTPVPLTIVYSKWRDGGKRSENNRVYMTSYGAYGSGSGVGYSSYVNTLLDRGFTYVIAHVRGGNDLGMQWYYDGRMLKKKNTFTDFIACAEYLVEKGYAEKGTITAQGGSAGGLLMGAVANMRPDLFRAIILDVPFVDVINTMMDDKLPLTVGEYLEWGNPNKKKYYQYMREYSPYENVVAQDYPTLFFFTGLNDTRVGYWEPAKMVAKLRALKTDDNEIFLKTNLSAGHGGGSGRYAGLREAAYKLALIFDLYAVEEGVK